jgi:hypothetical protein
MAAPIVVIHIKPGGVFDVLACGSVRVIWVDDSDAEGDVFEQKPEASAAQILRILGAERTGGHSKPRPGQPAHWLQLVPKEPPEVA